MSLFDHVQRFAFDDLARTEAGNAILLVSESDYAELRELAARRAAPAHVCTVDLTGPQILELHGACGGDFTDVTCYTVARWEAFVDAEGDQMPAGIYITCAEYPEEGFIGPLGVEGEADQPKPALVLCHDCGRYYDPVGFGPGGCPWIGCPSATDNSSAAAGTSGSEP